MKIAYLHSSYPRALTIHYAILNNNVFGAEILRSLIFDLLAEGHEIYIKELHKYDKRVLDSLYVHPLDRWFVDAYKTGRIQVGLPRDPDFVLTELAIFIPPFSQHIIEVLEYLNSVSSLLVFIHHDNSELFYHRMYGSGKNKIDTMIRQLKGREMIHLHSCLRDDKYREVFKIPDEIKLFFALGISGNEPSMQPMEKPLWDLLWLGGETNYGNMKKAPEKYRRGNILGYYFRGRKNSVVVGKWTIETMRKYPDVNFLGRVGSMKDTWDVLHLAGANIFYGNEQDDYVCHVLNRMKQIIQSGSILLHHTQYPEVFSKFIKGYIHVTPENIDNYIGLSYEERLKINQEQKKTFKRWVEYPWYDYIKKHS